MADFISSLEVLLQNLIRQLEWVMLFSVIGGGIYLCFQRRGYPLRKITKPFKIIIGNPEFVKGTYNDEHIDFITNANRLTKVNTIYFLNE